MWLVCQIGAREHYSVARGLQRAGRLGALVTDFWLPPGAMAGHLPGARRLADRFHPDLASATVHAGNARMLGFELLARVQKRQGWQRVLARNALFQREALKVLAAYSEHLARLTPLGTSGRAQRSRPTDLRSPTSVPCPLSPVPCLFSYSYAALDLFRHAKQRGWQTVLGQIDPGPGEAAIVRRLRAQHPEWVGPGETSPPDAYWEQWREECALADRIVVNSAWSRSLLIDAGIEAAKIEVVALAFEEEEVVGCQLSVVRDCEFEPRRSAQAPQTTDNGQRTTLQSPLRVLWLGQVNVRKGIQDLAAAAKMLDEAAGRHGFVDAGTKKWNGGGQDARATVDRASCPEPSSAKSRTHRTTLARTPVRIDVVGPHGPLPAGLSNNMVFHGAVARSEVGGWYDQADVFVLPTHSDGFALTQLEAMAHGLPVIATPCCGDVVEEGVNGWLVPAGDPQALAERMRWIAENPGALEPMRHAARLTAAKFGLERMVEALVRS